MCRFVFYSGAPSRLSSLLTEPTHSIIHQSYQSKEREEPLNGDGFGVGWYVPEESDAPAIFKDVTPAWNNQNLTSLAAVVRSPCIVAHVRAATPGLPVSQLNCHPFSWREFLFAHNGQVGNFQAIRRKIQSELSDEAFNLLSGSTDSEHVFALFAKHYDPASTDSKIHAMAAARSSAITTIEGISAEHGTDAPSDLNLVLTDGVLTVITRYASHGPKAPNSLYVHSGSAYECKDGICRMQDRSESSEAIIVASEPLGQDDGWRPAPENSMLLIDRNAVIEERSMEMREFS